jgi:hypothetical protein
VLSAKTKTPLAILRLELGEYGSQEKFAALIGKSISWVRHATNGRIPVTREAAYKIGVATGVNPEWLISDDLSVQPTLAASGGPFTYEAFRRHQSATKSLLPALIDPVTEAGLERIPHSILKILHALYDLGQSPWRFDEVLQNLDSFANHLSQVAGSQKSPQTEQALDPRKMAFDRLALRSALELIKQTSPKVRSAAETNSKVS